MLIVTNWDEQMIYYTADPHLGHKNIIGLCNRPFADVEEMNETIIANWRGIVRPEDDIYILGDLMYRNETPPIKLLERLTGHLHLIRGNHDHFIKKDPECKKFFDSVDDLLSISDEGRRVILCHYPIAEWEGFYHGAYHLYGHIHNGDCGAKRIMEQIPRSYNVGMDCLNFVPMTLTQIIDFYNTERS